MKKDFETRFTGWSFMLAALMLFFGYEMLHHKIGEYFVANDFKEVGKDVWFWIWMYRIHIFGWVILGGAMMAFMAITYGKPQRVLLMPGAGIVVVGTFTMALAVAFYYTFGAWGVGRTMDLSQEESDLFMDHFLVFNHYATCMIRFGRIFSALGYILLGIGFFKWKIFPSWYAVFTAVMGLVSMCIILFIFENFYIFKPMYYINLVWMIVTGYLLLRRGVNLETKE